MTTRLSQTEFLTVLDPLPLENIGWTVRVLSERNYTTQVALVNRFIGMGFTDEVNGCGGGKVVLDPDDNLFTQPLPAGETAPLIDQEAVWQFYEDGVWRFDMMAEDVREDVVPEGGGPRTTEVIGRGTGMVLDWAKVLPAGMPTPTSFTRKFTGKHPLAVWVQLFNEAQAAGYLPFVSLLFDATQDSAAGPWGPAQAVEVNAGDSLLDMLSRWCEANDYTWRMLRGFRLQVLPLSLGRRLGNRVVFTLYRGQQKHEKQRTRREIATDVYAASGDKGLAYVSDADAVAKWKRRMLWLSAGDSSDAGARSAVANSTLALVKDEKVSRTIAVPPDEPNRRVFVDYGLTDWIMVEVPDGDGESGERQVRAIAVDIDQNANTSLELVLQSRFESRQEKIQRILDRLGASETSGTGSKISVEQATTATKVSDLSDVDLAGIQTGDLFQWNGAKWVDKTPNLSLLKDVDVTTTPPTDKQAMVFDVASGKWKPGTVAAASGGGGGSIPWVKRLDLPLGTLTGWSVGGGTWVTTAGQVEQTLVSNIPKKLTYEGLPLDNAEVVVEVEVKASGYTGLHQAGIFLSPGGNVTGGYAVQFHRPDGGAGWSKVTLEGSEGVTGTGTVTIANLTDTVYQRLRVHLVGGSASVFVNDVLVGTLRGSGAQAGAAKFVGLINYGCDATYRNLKVWTPVGPDEAGTPLPTTQDRRWTVGVGVTSIDEFDDETLDPAWVRVDKAGRSGIVTWQEKAGGLAAANTGGDTASELHAMMRPLSGPMAIGDAFVTCITILALRGDNAIGGLVLADGVTAGSGTQLWGMCWENNSAGVLNHAIYDTSGYQTNLTSSVTQTTKPMQVFQRLVKTGANAWRLDLSPDGASWLTGLGTSTRTVTPTHVGLASSSWAGSVKSVIAYEFLRRVSGVT